MPKRMPSGFIDPVYGTTNEEAQIESRMPARMPAGYTDPVYSTSNEEEQILSRLPARRPAGWSDPVYTGTNADVLQSHLGQYERSRKWAAIAARIAK